MHTMPVKVHRKLNLDMLPTYKGGSSIKVQYLPVGTPCTLCFCYMSAHILENRACTWKAHGNLPLCLSMRGAGIELGFNIPNHKSGLKKWWFWHNRFISSVWSVTHRPWGWQMSDFECVLFWSVCVCAAGMRVRWKRQKDWKGEQRAGCVRGVENYFFH